MINIRSEKKVQKKGFTLVEALVAVALVLLGVTAAFSSAQFGLSSTSAVRNRVTAMYLAQEAIEGVKNIKDTNLLARSAGLIPTPDWLEGINPRGEEVPCFSTIDEDQPNQACGYNIGNDTTPGTLQPCTLLSGCAVWTVNQSGENFYVQKSNGGSGTDVDTGFVRRVWVEEIVPGQEARVTVIISRPGTTFPDFRINSLIYNWF